LSAFKRFRITSKDIALSTVRLQPGSFKRPGSYSQTRTNARERRITVTFPGTANQPIVVFHGLGFAPSGYAVLSQGSGIIYNDTPLPSTSRVIVLKSNTANLVADILVR
jgi:hypothetical protein